MNRHILGIVAAMAFAPLANALTISFDYTYDENGFFTAERRSTLESAGSYIASFLGETRLASLQSEPAANGYGTNQASFVISNPSGNPFNTSTYVSNSSIAADTIVIFVGAESRPHYDTVLIGRGVGSAGSYYDSEYMDRMASRGTDSPKPWGGTISFNLDTSWYADQDPFQTRDFSNAEGEDLFTYSTVGLLGILGVFNLSDELISDGFFIGEHAVALDPNGLPVSSYNNSIVHDYESTIAGDYFTGETQHILAGDSVEFGQRKYVTAADLAVLADLGYGLTSVPEPATSSLLLASGAGVLVLLTKRKRHDRSVSKGGYDHG